jgi:hypothetical protein
VRHELAHPHVLRRQHRVHLHPLRPVPYYFISGNKDNCNRDEKLIVVVMAERDNGTQPATGLAPSPNSVRLI